MATRVMTLHEQDEQLRLHNEELKGKDADLYAKAIELEGKDD